MQPDDVTPYQLSNPRDTVRLVAVPAAGNYDAPAGSWVASCRVLTILPGSPWVETGNTGHATRAEAVAQIDAWARLPFFVEACHA